MYRTATTTLIGDVLVRFSKSGDFELTFSKGPGVTLLKAASYLMHSDNFSQVRGYLLAHSKVILEDDSGIPYRFFSNNKWNVRFVGPG